MRTGPGGQRSGPPVAFTLSPAYVRSTVGISPVGFEDFANLEVARLRERQGDLRAALAAVSLLMGVGLGALNEVVEFAATRFMSTNVGGYVNTGWDLVANLVGAAGAFWLILLRPRRE